MIAIIPVLLALFVNTSQTVNQIQTIDAIQDAITHDTGGIDE